MPYATSRLDEPLKTCRNRDHLSFLHSRRATPTPASARAASMAADEYRCWICLDDAESLDGMVAPCKCVGTNKWVHEKCLRNYCEVDLAAHGFEKGVAEVHCPICKSEIRIVRRGAGSARQAWRQTLRVTATDGVLLERHCRFFFLIAPLLVATLACWAWLLAYWHDLRLNGPGPYLTSDAAAVRWAPDSQLRSPIAAVVKALLNAGAALRSALEYAGFHVDFTELSEAFAADISSLQPGSDSSPAQAAEAPSAADPTPELLELHPSGITKHWSELYVWLQYAQWYKVGALALALTLA